MHNAPVSECKTLKTLFPFILHFWTNFAEQVTYNSEWFCNDLSHPAPGSQSISHLISYSWQLLPKWVFQMHMGCLDFWVCTALSSKPEKMTECGLKSRITNVPKSWSITILQWKRQLCDHSWFAGRFVGKHTPTSLSQRKNHVQVRVK